MELNGSEGSRRPYREVLVVGVYAGLVALPFAAIVHEMMRFVSTAGTVLATGVTAALFWLWLAVGRERVSLLRGAAIGTLVGVVFHSVYSFGASLYFYLESWGEAGFVESLSAGLKMAIIYTVFGGIVSVPVGIGAFVLYVGLVRPRLFTIWRRAA